MQRYIELASNSNIDVKVTAADYLLANSRGVFDLDNPQDMKSLEHIARGYTPSIILLDNFQMINTGILPVVY